MAREWRRDSPPVEAAERVAEQLWGSATLLPMVRFVCASTFPVVTWDRDALMQRKTAAPLLHPKLVEQVLTDVATSAEIPPVLRIVGFVGVSPLATAYQEHASLRGIARTVVMVAPHGNPRTMTLAECDAQGTAVVSVRAAGPQVVVPGDPGPRAGSAMSPIWLRLFGEQLFDWAIRSGRLPE